jgi:hypothetical protein
MVTVVEDDERDHLVLVKFGGPAGTSWYVQRDYLTDPAGVARAEAQRKRTAADTATDPTMRSLCLVVADELDRIAEQLDGAS